MRRLAVLAFCLPLMIVGGIGAHWLSYLVVVPDATARETLLAATGHAYATWLPALVAIGAAVALVTLAALALGRGTAIERARLRPSAFLALPILAWTAQEPLERLAAGYANPLHVWLEPVFWRGLVFQVPFAALAMLVAAVLLRVARAVRIAVGAGRTPRLAIASLPPRALTGALLGAVAPRVRAGDALAFRGPPAAAHAGR